MRRFIVAVVIVALMINCFAIWRIKIVREREEEERRKGEEEERRQREEEERRQREEEERRQREEEERRQREDEERRQREEEDSRELEEEDRLLSEMFPEWTENENIFSSTVKWWFDAVEHSRSYGVSLAELEAKLQDDVSRNKANVFSGIINSVVGVFRRDNEVRKLLFKHVRGGTIGMRQINRAGYGALFYPTLLGSVCQIVGKTSRIFAWTIDGVTVFNAALKDLDEGTITNTVCASGNALGGYYGAAYGAAMGYALLSPIPVIGPLVGGIAGGFIGISVATAIGDYAACLITSAPTANYYKPAAIGITVELDNFYSILLISFIFVCVLNATFREALASRRVASEVYYAGFGLP